MKPAIIKDLGDGLVLRRATPADADALAVFNSRIHSDDGPDKPDERVGAWTRDLLTRPHPTFQPDDFTIVEETATGRIVSSLNLLSQTWSYAGIPFGVGRPEVVGTLPEFRKRGLIRLQFDEIHRWSAERGQLVQVITGIPYYYRQFGYEMALDLSGGRAAFQAQIEKMKPDEDRPYKIRRAEKNDLPFLHDLYAQAGQRYLVNCLRPPEVWAYEHDGQSEKNVARLVQCVIEDKKGKPVGYVLHRWFLGMSGMMCMGYELTPGTPWLDVTPWVAQYLWQTGQEYSKTEGKPCDSVGFFLGADHPVYHAIGERRLAVQFPTYAYYVRVADLPGFLRLIAPELERRLAASPAVGFSGELGLSFYRSGLRLGFENGHLTKCEEFTPLPEVQDSAGFPYLTFLQLVFGHRTLDEIRILHPDCWYNNEQTRLVLNSLFPRRLSAVLPAS